jgi:hypothetical protein
VSDLSLIKKFMTFNWYIPFLAALVPMVIGFIWYNPKVFGSAWMKAADMSPEKAKGANMGVVFGLAYFFSLLVSVGLIFMTIHQTHIFSILAGDPELMTPGSESNNVFTGLMAKYGTNFRTFKHGALHGVIGAILTALPIIGTNAIFERKGFKYIAINVGYWIITMCLMGGIICAYL